MDGTGLERQPMEQPLARREQAMVRVFYHDVFDFPLPEGHRFPKEKYRMLRERLLARGVLRPQDLHLPHAATVEELTQAHTPDYVARTLAGRWTRQEERRVGLPWSPQLVERARRSVGSTLAAARAALEDGLGINLGGGTHHAGPDWGAGFCVFNDVAVAARVLLAQGRVGRILVLDLDVHQGDGTAAIAAGDARLFTFSMHGERNFPFRKVPGDLDIGLPDGTDDRSYLEALRRGLAEVERRFQPQLVFYIAGADPYRDDRLGRLALTKEGLLTRDRLVFAWVRQRALPLVLVMGGGYARHIEDTVDIHMRTVALALSLWEGARPQASR